MSRQKTIRKLSPDDFYNARRYLHERSSFDEIFTALDRILPTLCEAGRLPKDNTGSKGSSSPMATGLQVLSIGGTNAEFDVRLATALCGRRKHVIYNVAETSEAYRQHVDEVLQQSAREPPACTLPFPSLPFPARITPMFLLVTYTSSGLL